jgi:hypothetical protein
MPFLQATTGFHVELLVVTSLAAPASFEVKMTHNLV